MKVVKVNCFDAQTPERLLSGPQNMTGGEIVPMWRIGCRITREDDTALGRNQDPIPHSGDFTKCLAENSLAHPAAVDVGMIKECVARFVCGDYGLAPLGRSLRRHLFRVPG